MPFPTYKTKVEIPQGAEDVYEEKDGQWVPIVPDTTTLKGTLDKVRDEKRDAEKALASAREDAAKAARELDALKAQIGDPDKKTNELLSKWEKDKDAAVAAVQAKLDEATGRLRTLTLDDKAKAAFVKVGGRAEKADAALRLAKDRLDLAEDRIVVKDDKGQVTTTTVEDYWAKEFRKDMPEFYKGTEARGGGAGGVVTGSPGAAGALTAEQIMANPALAFQAANAQE